MDVRACVRVIADHQSAASVDLLNALKYSSKHDNYSCAPTKTKEQIDNELSKHTPPSQWSNTVDSKANLVVQ